MLDETLSQLRFFELFPAALEEINENFGDIYLLGDNKTKQLVKGFLIETYQNFVETIKKIDSALSFMSNSVDYKELKKSTEKLKEFLEKYKEIFIAAGIANEDEIKDKEITLSKFLTH